jgi:hypothetical protein
LKLNESVCQIRKALPKIRIGVLEWDTSEIVGEFLHCNEEAETVCYTDDFGRTTCLVRRKRPEETNPTP